MLAASWRAVRSESRRFRLVHQLVEQVLRFSRQALKFERFRYPRIKCRRRKTENGILAS